MELFTDYTLRNIALGTAILGIVSGALGCFALLRRQSLLGDAISHAALPGVVVAFMLFSENGIGTRLFGRLFPALVIDSKGPIVLMVGALIAGWLSTIIILAIVQNTRIKEDGAIGLGMSVFFGVGLMLLTFVQNNGYKNQAGLDTFLFGQAAALVQKDVIVMGVIGTIAIIGMLVFWKEFKLVSFDRDFAASIGFPTRTLDIVLTTLLVIAIVIGLEAVGVVLMSAMVVAPAAAARQWTDKLSVMVVTAALFGAISGVGGAIITTNVDLPTGPVIVLLITLIAVLSLLFAPQRGLVWDWGRQQRNRRRLQRNLVLESLYVLALKHDDARGHPVETLRMMAMGQRGIQHTLDYLRDEGLAFDENGLWRLTEAGSLAADALLTETESTQAALAGVLQ